MSAPVDQAKNAETFLADTVHEVRLDKLLWALNGSCSNVCPVKIDIHEQIYGWREVMEENDQIAIVKKEAMRAVDKVLSHPTLYQIATATVSTALEVLPHFAMYNRLNPWGKHRDVPEATPETFHEWYKNNRLGANQGGRV